MRRDVTMAQREILTYPDQRLKQVSQQVTALNDQVSALITDLDDTFTVAPGCVGISAPQIGELWRVIIVDATRSGSKKAKKTSTLHGKLICINPTITACNGSLVFREGCLSIPDFTGNVVRSEQITVEYLDERFEPQKIDASGFESVIFQHEIDHLNGVLFLDNVRSFKRDVFRRKRYQ